MLGLCFSNFNPRANFWVDKVYQEKFFEVFPSSMVKATPRIRKQLLKLFKVKILTDRTLLAEEGGINTEVYIVLQGGILVFRRMPGDKEVTVRDRAPIVEQEPEPGPDTQLVNHSASPSRVRESPMSPTRISGESRGSRESCKSPSRPGKRKPTLAEFLKYKDANRLEELTSVHQDPRKSKFASIEERIAAGELGEKILHSAFECKFSMVGEDNVLLGQTNNYSVVTDRRNCVVAAASTQELFRLLADADPEVKQEMRLASKNK